MVKTCLSKILMKILRSLCISVLIQVLISSNVSQLLCGMLSGDTNIPALASYLGVSKDFLVLAKYIFEASPSLDLGK